MLSGPASYGCETCKASYPMGHETIARLYLKQPWFNHLETRCPGCKTIWEVWELQPETERYLQDNNAVEGDAIRWEVSEFASDAIWRAFCKATDRPYPTEPALSQRAAKHIDAEVAFFGFLLERGELCSTE